MRLAAAETRRQQIGLPDLPCGVSMLTHVKHEELSILLATVGAALGSRRPMACRAVRILHDDGAAAIGVGPSPSSSRCAVGTYPIAGNNAVAARVAGRVVPIRRAAAPSKRVAVGQPPVWWLRPRTVLATLIVSVATAIRTAAESLLPPRRVATLVVASPPPPRPDATPRPTPTPARGDRAGGGRLSPRFVDLDPRDVAPLPRGAIEKPASTAVEATPRLSSRDAKAKRSIRSIDRTSEPRSTENRIVLTLLFVMLDAAFAEGVWRKNFRPTLRADGRVLTSSRSSSLLAVTAPPFRHPPPPTPPPSIR